LDHPQAGRERLGEIVSTDRNPRKNLGHISDYLIQRNQLQRNVCRSGQQLQLVQASLGKPLMLCLGRNSMDRKSMVRSGCRLDLGHGLGDDTDM
jgi:hypothetical protein